MWARRVAINLRPAMVVGAIAGALILSGQAEAQQSQQQDGKTVGDLLKRIDSNAKKVQFSKAKSSLPSVQKGAIVPPPAHENLSQIRPPSRSSMYYEQGTNEAELEKVTDQGINQLYKLTQQFKTSKRRGELWLRLAELYVEKSRLIEFKLQQTYDDQLKKAMNDKNARKPVIDLRASQDYNRKAIQLYEWFIRDFPKDPKIDQSLFFLGYNYFELDRAEKGRDYYKRLTAEFPHSNYVEESNFALAEFYFDREKWLDAMKYYEAVAINKKARLYSFALYKLAWCQYKTGKVKQALISLEHVIHAGRAAKGAKDGSAGGVGRIRLATEAQRDLVVFYAEAGRAQDARAYFMEVAGDKASFGLLEKLAYYYADTGNRDGARYIFRQLIDERPTAPKAYDYQYQIVTMYTSLDKGDVYKAELYNWIQTYSPDSDWARANAKDKELVAKANQLIETTLRNQILQAHQTAQNSKMPTARKVAKEGYELYFKSIRQGPHLDEMHFFYAELLFDMNDYSLAAAHYTWVVENAPKSQYFEKAVLNTVLALEKGLPKEEDLKKQVEGKLEPVAFSSTVHQFEVAAERYMKTFPRGENVPAIRYKLGVLYYYHNQFDKALAMFNGIIRDYPKSPYAQYCANLTLDIYNLRKDYAGLEKAGQEIMANDALRNSPVGAQVKGVLQRASFKRAQDLEANKDYGGAAQAYEEFARKNPGGDLATSASFNSAVNYEKSGDSFKAISMYGMVMADHSGKNEKLRKDSSKFMAVLYEKTGQYQKAAESFESYANKNDKEKEAVAFYFNAAVIRDGMNSYNQALANYEKYFDKTRSGDKWETVFLMAKLWERRGNRTKAEEFYQKYYDQAHPRNPGNAIEAAFKIAQFKARKGQKKDSEDWLKKVIYQQSRSSTAEKPVGVSYAAEAKYTFVAKTYLDLRAIRIPANPAKQGKAVQEKLSILNRLKEQLKEVIRYDDAYMVVNSLTLIGEAYQHMAASIYGVPLPKGLDDEGMKQYKAGVDKVAQPFTEEAIKNYSAAIERGFKLEGYNDGLKSAERELNRLDKEKFVNYGERAVITKLPDLLGVDSDSTMGSVWKAKDEPMMVEMVAKILGKDANDLRALNTLAMFYVEQNKLGMGRLILARAQKVHAQEPCLENNMGVIELAEAKQRPAIANFRKALELKPGYSISGANLGSIYVEYRDYPRAVELLEEGYHAVKADLRHAVNLAVANNYALALSGVGEIEKSKDVYQTILKADSQDPTATLNYTILLIQKLKDKKEGEKMLNRLKLIVDDNDVRQRVDELEKALNES